MPNMVFIGDGNGDGHHARLYEDQDQDQIGYFAVLPLKFTTAYH